MSIGVGERFPALGVTTADGEQNLSDSWSHGPLVIAFHRMWCPFCQQAALQLTGAAPELRRLGASAVIVYREDVDKVTHTCAQRHTEALCVSDADRSLERAVDLDRFSLSRYAAFSPRRILNARRAGATIGGVGTNILQGRGTFVVDRDGKVVYAHQATTAADIPPIDDIVDAARRAD